MKDIDTSVLPTEEEIELLKKFDRYQPDRKCGDCGAVPGQAHDPGCDVERCSVCSRQALQGCVHVCALSYDEDPDEPNHSDPEYCGFSAEDYEGIERHDPTKVRWTGVWPGVLECIKLGLFSYEDPSRSTGQYWVPCSPDHPKATPDLNFYALVQAGAVSPEKLKERQTIGQTKTVPVYDRTSGGSGAQIGEATVSGDGTGVIRLDGSSDAKAIFDRLMNQGGFGISSKEG